MDDPSQLISRVRPEAAWEPFSPSRKSRWDTRKAAHLYRRAAFGAAWADVEAAAKANPADQVRRLLQGSDGQESFDRDVARMLPGVLESNSPQAAQSLWMYRLLYSPHPLVERMTLFWHDHFATSQAKVNSPRLMQRQHEALRRNALGSFATLLRDMTFDPAMIVWLDSAENRKGAPNENYAREVFELFSLGVGNYTEKDIQEAARALTGWKTENEQAVFVPALHDDGPKTIFGQTGHWTAGDVVRLCLQHPACAKFLVGKLFREFVNESVAPSEELLAPLVVGFQQRDYDIGWLMERILGSWLFFSDAAIAQRIKSPVEFVVGIVRGLEGRMSPERAVEGCSRLGQSLFHPPSVKGWDGGKEWVNSSTLLLRQNIAFQATRGDGEVARLDPARLTETRDLSSNEQFATFFLEIFLQQPNHAAKTQIAEQLEEDRRAFADRPFATRALRAQLSRSAAHLVLALPEFQLG